MDHRTNPPQNIEANDPEADQLYHHYEGPGNDQLLMSKAASSEMSIEDGF